MSGAVSRIFGYARVSTIKQSVERQVTNIRAAYPGSVIITEAYTGTKMDRPKWNSLIKQIHDGDTIVFDEVSRMSRDADEGFLAYKELYEKGVNLIFLKESTLNTDNFRNAMQIDLTGTDVDLILEGINKYLMALAENQIKAAFATSQHEVDFLHKRTSEGVRRAQAEGKQVGLEKGRKLITKKSVEMKEKIRKLSKDFDGRFCDSEVIDLIKINRHTYYKYKKEMLEEITV